jgi:hypothetical protein
LIATMVILVGTVALVQFAGDRLVRLTTPRIRTAASRGAPRTPAAEPIDA